MKMGRLAAVLVAAVSVLALMGVMTFGVRSRELSPTPDVRYTLISALTGKRVSRSIAMTGEVTITGRVLPIGGLKEKTMAAYLADVKRVIIPEENVRDLDDIDAKVRETLEFVPAKHMDDVIRAVFSYMSVEEQSAEKREEYSVVVPSALPTVTGVRK